MPILMNLHHSRHWQARSSLANSWNQGRGISRTFLSSRDVQNQLRSWTWSDLWTRGKASGDLPLTSQSAVLFLPAKCPLCWCSLYPLSLRWAIGFQFLWEIFFLPLLPLHLALLLCRQFCPLFKAGLEGIGNAPLRNLDEQSKWKTPKENERSKAKRKEAQKANFRSGPMTTSQGLLLHYSEIILYQKHLEISESLPWVWKTKWKITIFGV